MNSGPEIGLYIHIPFCLAKCAYCDFNSYAGLDDQFDAYVAALVYEIEGAGAAQVQTIYIGGGTPTVLPPSRVGRILDATRVTLGLDPGAEVTIEANPGTVDADALGTLRGLGINRLSLGVQSFDPQELCLLGRIHSPEQAIAAVAAARQAGFENLSLDLIYGLPGQSLPAWQASLRRALALQPDHLSLYALSVEEGTPLAAAIGRREMSAPDPDRAADMYELAQETLAGAGFVHYEISNWARSPEFICRHNLIYWRNEPYLGVGAGAHSWLDGRRWSNLARPEDYTARVLAGEPPIAAQERIAPDLEMGETMMMGLRLLDAGVEYERFRARFGVDLRRRYAGELADLEAAGLVELDGERVRLSERGRLLGNQVFGQFLP